MTVKVAMICADGRRECGNLPCRLKARNLDSRMSVRVPGGAISHAERLSVRCRSRQGGQPDKAARALEICRDRCMQRGPTRLVLCPSARPPTHRAENPHTRSRKHERAGACKPCRRARTQHRRRSGSMWRARGGRCRPCDARPASAGHTKAHASHYGTRRTPRITTLTACRSTLLHACMHCACARHAHTHAHAV
jgi:hypothetical protein